MCYPICELESLVVREHSMEIFHLHIYCQTLALEHQPEFLDRHVKVGIVLQNLDDLGQNAVVHTKVLT